VVKQPPSTQYSHQKRETAARIIVDAHFLRCQSSTRISEYASHPYRQHSYLMNSASRLTPPSPDQTLANEDPGLDLPDFGTQKTGGIPSFEKENRRVGVHDEQQHLTLPPPSPLPTTDEKKFHVAAADQGARPAGKYRPFVRVRMPISGASSLDNIGAQEDEKNLQVTAADQGARPVGKYRPFVRVRRPVSEASPPKNISDDRDKKTLQVAAPVQGTSKFTGSYPSFVRVRRPVSPSSPLENIKDDRDEKKLQVDAPVQGIRYAGSYLPFVRVRRPISRSSSLENLGEDNYHDIYC